MVTPPPWPGIYGDSAAVSTIGRRTGAVYARPAARRPGPGASKAIGQIRTSWGGLRRKGAGQPKTRRWSAWWIPGRCLGPKPGARAAPASHHVDHPGPAGRRPARSVLPGAAGSQRASYTRARTALRAHLTGEPLRSSIDVRNRLLADDVPHELSALPGTLRDLAAAPDVLGLPAVAVGQPTVFADARGAVVVLAPAGVEVDETGVAVLLGRDELAPVAPDQAPGLTGYLLQFVPPVALECPAIVLVDEQLAGEDVVYTAAGEPGVILKVRGSDLVKATNAVVTQVTQVTKVVDGPR